MSNKLTPLGDYFYVSVETSTGERDHLLFTQHDLDRIRSRAQRLPLARPRLSRFGRIAARSLRFLRTYFAWIAS